MRKSLFPLLFILLILLPQECFAATLYENQTISNGAWNCYGIVWVAETFAVGSTAHTVTSIKVKLYQTGTSPDLPGTGTISIKAVDGNNHPTGSDLTSASVDGNSLTTDTAGAWYTYAVSEITLSANTNYSIVLRFPSATSNNQGPWCLQDPSSYSYGTFHHSNDGGSTWLKYTTGDTAFEIWGNPINNAPTNDQLSLDLTGASYKGTKTLLAAKQDYKFVHKCSDANGVTDISYAQITLDQGGKGVVLRATRGSGDSWTFSENSDPSNYVTLNTGGSSHSTSGNQKTFNYLVTINWNWGDSAETLTVRGYVIDSQSASDTDDYSNIFGVEDDLSASSLAVSNYNPAPSEILTFSGYWYYEGTSIAPPDGNYNVQVKLSGVQKGSTDTTLVSGAFSISDVTAESTAGEYAYTVECDHMTSAGTFSTVTVGYQKTTSETMGFSDSISVVVRGITLSPTVSGSSGTTSTIITVSAVWSNGSPIPNANIEIYGDSLLGSALTNSSGIAEISLSGSLHGSGTLTVNCTSGGKYSFPSILTYSIGISSLSSSDSGGSWYVGTARNVGVAFNKAATVNGTSLTLENCTVTFRIIRENVVFASQTYSTFDVATSSYTNTYQFTVTGVSSDGAATFQTVVTQWGSSHILGSHNRTIQIIATGGGQVGPGPSGPSPISPISLMIESADIRVERGKSIFASVALVFSGLTLPGEVTDVEFTVPWVSVNRSLPTIPAPVLGQNVTVNLPLTVSPPLDQPTGSVIVTVTVHATSGTAKVYSTSHLNVAVVDVLISASPLGSLVVAVIVFLLLLVIGWVLVTKKPIKVRRTAKPRLDEDWQLKRVEAKTRDMLKKIRKKSL